LEEKVAAPVKKIGNTAVGIRCADHATPLYPRKLALTLLTSGSRLVGIVSMQARTMVFVLRFNFKKLNVAFEDLDAEVDTNSAWKTIKENIKISASESLGYYELKKHNPWSD
jgi:hypothetical protein